MEHGVILISLKEMAIRKLIRDKTTDQLKLSFALWTRQAIQEIIRLKFGGCSEFRIKMPIRTVGEYLRRWGFTPQKPLKQAYEQQPKAVRKWLKEEYIEMHKGQRRREGRSIGETKQASAAIASMVAAMPRREKLRLSAKRCSVNMISTVTNRGKVRFMIYKETMNAEVLIKFMKHLIKGSVRLSLN